MDDWNTALLAALAVIALLAVGAAVNMREWSALRFGAVLLLAGAIVYGLHVLEVL